MAAKSKGMKAYVLIETAPGKTKAIRKALGAVSKGAVANLDAVTGPYDFIAVVEGPTLDAIGRLVTDEIGASSTDYFLLLMNDESVEGLMKDKFELGAEAGVAAGPVGRDAEASTNATMTAEMLSYSRAQGVFAGVSLAGASLGPDESANEKLYGKKVDATQIIAGSAGPPPPSAKELLAVLTSKSPTNVAKDK